MDATTALHDAWRCGFHITPPTGWLNDPNGLCQFHGVYHVFHQYSPAWPEPDAPRGWGHAVSRDLVRWEHVGMAIEPDTADEATGSYSGCAVMVPGAAPDGGDLLRLYYTGNVKEPGDFDYIHEGRRATQILIETADGHALSPKRPLLRNDDYPPTCSCHVRDPKVWRQDGFWWMLLGARDLFDKGLLLLYRSDDGVAWSFHATIHSGEAFGFMWECPDRIAIDGHEYVSFCPQGMQALPWSNGMRDQSGYIQLEKGERVCDAPALDVRRFQRWDYGFDFYAPQTFVDESGRTLLIGWMGMPEAPFESAPDGLGWIHCLTLPRVVTRASDGSLLQSPAPELEELREERFTLDGESCIELPGRRADIVCEGISGSFALTLDDAFEVRFATGELSIEFIDDVAGTGGVGAGRTRRSCSLDSLDDLRVLVDGSAVEVFANGGRAAFATRWFPRREALAVALEGTCADASVWSMGNGMVGCR